MKKTVAELDREIQALTKNNQEQHEQIFVKLGEIKDLIWSKFYENGYEERMKRFDKYLDGQEKRRLNTKYFWIGVLKSVLTSVLIGALMYLFFIYTGFQF